MLSYNNITEQEVRDGFANNYIFPSDEQWLFYDEDKNGNSSYNKVVVTYKQIDLGGFLLDNFTVYQLSNNGNLDIIGGDKQTAIDQVLNTIELHFTNQEFIDSLEL